MPVREMQCTSSETVGESVKGINMKKAAIESAHKHLKKHPQLKKVLKLGLGPRSKPSEPFTALVRSIVYQQLSGKAAGTILGRLLAYFPGGTPTPALMLKLSEARMRKAGLSGQKIVYLRDLAKRFIDGTIEPKKFPKMSDEEIREHLLIVKGIGRWTADMFLMFTLHRPDVLPTGDLAIQKGFQKVFGLKSRPDVKKMEKLAKDWIPHRTVASLYLWRCVDEGTDNW